MRWDIVVRSYWKDAGWLELCLAAVGRHAHGFGAVVVVAPRASRPWLRHLAALAPHARFEWCEDYDDDYLGQQVTKLNADRYTDADVICHLDSDCIVVRPMGPGDLTTDDRPHVVLRPGEELGRHWPWRAPTEAFLGWELTHDFMQRPPFAFPRWLHAEVRAHAQAVHGTTIDCYVTSRPSRGFSEFNVLGALAHARFAEQFEWIEYARATTADPLCRWYWSWDGVESARPAIERELGLR